MATTTSEELGQGTERKLSQQVADPAAFVQVTTRTEPDGDVQPVVGRALLQ